MNFVSNFSKSVIIQINGFDKTNATAFKVLFDVWMFLQSDNSTYGGLENPKPLFKAGLLMQSPKDFFSVECSFCGTQNGISLKEIDFVHSFINDLESIDYSKEKTVYHSKFKDFLKYMKYRKELIDSPAEPNGIENYRDFIWIIEGFIVNANYDYKGEELTDKQLLMIRANYEETILDLPNIQHRAIQEIENVFFLSDGDKFSKQVKKDIKTIEQDYHRLSKKLPIDKNKYKDAQRFINEVMGYYYEFKKRALELIKSEDRVIRGENASTKTKIDHPFKSDEIYDLFIHIESNYKRKEKVKYTYIYEYIVRLDNTLTEEAYFDFAIKHSGIEMSTRPQPSATVEDKHKLVEELANQFIQSNPNYSTLSKK